MITRAVVLVSALFLAGAAAGAAGREVTIRDSSLSPVELRVPVGATVTFANAGRRVHRLVAERNLFGPLVLRPRAKVTARFYLAGRYPYKVDGRRKGVIVVGTPIAGYPPRPGSTVTTAKHRYSVRIEALIDETIVVGTRRDARRLEWVSTIPALVLTVQSVGDTTSVVGRAARGTFVGSFEFTSTRTNDAPCAGTAAYRLASEAVLQGGKEPRESWVSFDAGLPPAAATEYDAIRAAAATAACGSSLDDADWLDETIPVYRGIQIHHPPSFSISAWDTRWSVRRRGTPFPLDKMLTGESFAVDTGTRAFAGRSCGAGCSETFEGRARYVFTALPPR